MTGLEPLALFVLAGLSFAVLRAPVAWVLERYFELMGVDPLESMERE